MRKALVVIGVILLTGLAGAQSTSGTQSSAKPATTAKPAASAPAQPTAIIDTTAGKMTCTLFPDKAPIGVANFIGLANGTKDWTNPASGRKMNGVPLYNGS